jgi:two-component system, chemotaxis family, chemotaxis protein CheY
VHHRLGGISVLLVDDYADTALLIKEYLRFHGAEVQIASTAWEAVSYLATTRFDVIVTDYTMPGMTGFELLDHVRDMSLQPLAAILYTGSEGLDRRAREAGFAAYIVKPESPALLVNTIERLVNRWEDTPPPTII